jgi:hypothetical protein
MLRDSLEGPAYNVIGATDAESALAILRRSERGMIVLFQISLFDNTLSGVDSVAILGAAAHDPRLADQHAFVVITPTPENVDLVFGRMIERIGASIVAEPVEPERLGRAIADAERLLLLTA